MLEQFLWKKSCLRLERGPREFFGSSARRGRLFRSMSASRPVKGNHAIAADWSTAERRKSPAADQQSSERQRRSPTLHKRSPANSRTPSPNVHNVHTIKSPRSAFQDAPRRRGSPHGDAAAKRKSPVSGDRGKSPNTMLQDASRQAVTHASDPSVSRAPLHENATQLTPGDRVVRPQVRHRGLQQQPSRSNAVRATNTAGAAGAGTASAAGAHAASAGVRNRTLSGSSVGTPSAGPPASLDVLPQTTDIAMGASQPPTALDQHFLEIGANQARRRARARNTVFIVLVRDRARSFAGVQRLQGRGQRTAKHRGRAQQRDVQ